MKNEVIVVVLLLLSSLMHSQIKGCTDPLSKNYNPMATVNDGSCEYKPASVSVVSFTQLPQVVVETSGLLLWNDLLYTQNDNTDTHLYGLDKVSGTVTQVFSLTGAANQDWEDIAQDEEYLYIGDFGNNVNGARTNLKILRVSKASLQSGNPEVENIDFHYSEQTDFMPLANNVTNFDCEAMVVSQDSIYLFTKQWSAKKTSVYAVPKVPGNYTALLKTAYDVNGLITGATYLEDKKLLVLCGYSSLVQPFVYLFYDFNGHNFFSGNKRKITLSGMSFNQVEGIASSNGTDYFVTNEEFVQPFINIPQKLHRFNLSVFLSGYLENLTLGEVQNSIRKLIRIYPNPTRDVVHLDADKSIKGERYIFMDINGKEVHKGILSEGFNRVDVHRLAAGIYIIKLEKFPSYSYRLVRQ